MKKCSSCKEFKPFSDFWKHRATKDGYNSWCKKCYRPNAASRSVAGRPPAGGYTHKLFPPKMISEMRSLAFKRAAIRKIEFNLPTQLLHNLVLEFCQSNYYSIKPRHPFKPSIDRIDNSKGYTLDNIKICWLIENYCKNSFTEADVIEFCKRKLCIPLINADSK